MLDGGAEVAGLVVEMAVEIGCVYGGHEVGVGVSGGAGGEGLGEGLVAGVLRVGGRCGEHVLEPVVVVRLTGDDGELVKGGIDLRIGAAAMEPLAAGKGEELFEDAGWAARGREARSSRERLLWG